MSANISTNDEPPTVAITSPAAGQTVYGALEVEVAAGDDNGLARVELYGDAYLAQTLTAPPFSFTLDTALFTNGAHTVRAVAYDSTGLHSEAEVGVIVDNIFPVVSLKATRSVIRSLLLREYANVLTWADNPRNQGVQKYRIYRIDAGRRAMVAEVPKAPANTLYRYLHRRIDGSAVYIYEVTGVNGQGREGLAASAAAR
jgi:hypothetical protein